MEEIQTKTLEEQLHDLQKQIKVLSAKNEKEKRRAEIKEATSEAAMQLHDAYNCFVEAGFTEEQANELLMQAIKMGRNI